MRELRYRIHIKFGEQIQTFSTDNYKRENGRITFIDKYDQAKDFADTPEVLLGIEDTNQGGEE